MIYPADTKTLWLRELGPYGRTVDSEGRARTIAAFCVAQNSRELDGRQMRTDILKYLLGQSAFRHWTTGTGRLIRSGSAGSLKTVYFETSGLLECKNSVSGGGTVATSRDRVEWWIQRIINFDKTVNGHVFEI